MNSSLSDLIEAARDLQSEVPFGYSDYDRALVELIATVSGLSDLMANDKDAVAKMILGK